MPLDSEPPPSPVGNTPPTKHFCLSTMPCRILLSDVGKHYHAFPKGTFRSRLSNDPSDPSRVMHLPHLHLYLCRLLPQSCLQTTPPSPSSSMSSVQESTSHPQYSWLQPILDNERCPPLFKHVDSSMVPIYSHSIPNDVQVVLSVQYPKGSPRFMGFDSNGDLHVAAQALHNLIQMVLWATPMWPLPPLIPSVFK